MSELFKFAFNVPARRKNLGEILELLKEEKDLVDLAIKQKSGLSDKSIDVQLELISLKKRSTKIEHNITAKTEFLRELSKKSEIDKKEMERNIAAANSGSKKLIEEAEQFLDQEEKENGCISWAGNFIQFQMNGLIIAMEEKDEAKKVWYFNALKKQLKQISQKLPVNNNPTSPLKVAEDAEDILP